MKTTSLLEDIEKLTVDFQKETGMTVKRLSISGGTIVVECGFCA